MTSEQNPSAATSGVETAAAVEHTGAELPAGPELVGAPPAGPGLGEALRDTLAATAELPAKIGAWWNATAAAEGMSPALVFVYCAVILAAAHLVERVLFAAAGRLVPGKGASGEGYPARLRAAMWWALATGGRIALFAILASLGLALVADEGAAMAAVGGVLLFQVVRFRIAIAISELLVGAHDGRRRLMGFTDEEARLVMRRVLVALVIIVSFDTVRDLVLSVVEAGRSGVLVAVAAAAAKWLVALHLVVAIRKPVARLISETFAADAPPGSLARLLARYWFLFYVPVFLLGFVSVTYGYLVLGHTSPSAGANFSGLIVILAPLAVAGLRLWRDYCAENATKRQRAVLYGLFALAESAVIVAAVLLLLVVWGIDPFAARPEGFGRLLPRIVGAVTVIVVGAALWRMVAAFLEAYAPEGAGEQSALADSEGGGAGRSRMETVFPILKITAKVTIWTIIVMLALAALGVEILPLLAGAGIVGLAVGFGAQTLVKDVISGIFYLWEDAFRVGEFIETGEGKGVVEKILLRSVRLRHPRGAIYTVPFGSMGTIRNHSRDWVKVKFTFEVEPTEDVERVRKLVKKVGAALAEDPDLEGKFLEPMKSQGAIGMSGPNYQIGVKFVCRPGEQFVIRRKAYAALQKAFKEHGVALARPRVALDSLQPPGSAGKEAPRAAGGEG